TREHECLVAGTAELAPPHAEQLDWIRGEVDVALLMILRRGQVAVRVRASDTDHRFDEIEVAPRQGGQLCPHLRRVILGSQSSELRGPGRQSSAASISR